MKNLIRYSLFCSLLPWAFICYQYNQCHGYFAESYGVLGVISAAICWFNLLCGLLHIPYYFTLGFWLMGIPPSWAEKGIIEIILKILGLLGFGLILKKLPEKVLGCLLALLVALNIFQIVQRDISAQTRAQNLVKLNNKNTPQKHLSIESNIYWILCDAYTSNEVLKQYYQFDNRPFYEQLRNMGFNIIDGKLLYDRVNHFPTLKALNFYTGFNAFDVTQENALTLHYCLKNNKFFEILHNCGYLLYSTNSRFPFISSLKNITPVGPLQIPLWLQFLYHCTHQNRFFKTFLTHKLNFCLHQHQDQVFQYLENMSIKSKSFYYIHLDSPHAPFVRTSDNQFYDDQASVIWGENEVGSYAYNLQDYQQGYVAQLKGLNQKLLHLLLNIISKDPSATIILQGDHGTFITQNLKEHQSFFFAVRTKAKKGPIDPPAFFKQLCCE